MSVSATEDPGDRRTLRDDRFTLPVFTLAIFVGATLLFLVQPMAAKQVLPLLGGAPAVWNTAMVLFQALLLGGYLYAHVLASRVRSQRTQLLVHAVVLGLTCVALPIGLPMSWRTPPTESSPVAWLLLALIMSVGGPFFALSTTVPLLGRWFSLTGHRSAKDPYFLYAASNAGALLALLAYPVVIEPTLGLSRQMSWWSIGFGVYALLVLASGRILLSSLAAASPGVTAVSDSPTEAPAPGWKQRSRWILLAFVPSSLTLGVTQHFSTDIASFPMLWVLPLGVYLVTYIVAFSALGRVAMRVAAWCVPLLVVLVVTLLLAFQAEPIVPQMIVHGLCLLAVGLMCHGRLAEERPCTERLTEFYLLLSVGGVLGGVFNALLAPVIFSGIAEYPIALVVACLLRPSRPAAASAEDRVGDWSSGALWRRFEDFALPALLIALWIAMGSVAPWLASPGAQAAQPLLGFDRQALLWAGVPALACLLFAPRKLRFALGVVALLLTHWIPLWIPIFHAKPLLHQDRSFYGVHKVIRWPSGPGEWTDLAHGSTIHGVQYSLKPWSLQPTTYYATTGPIGDVMRALEEQPGDHNIALVGLGAGALATYAKPGWTLTFYDIDPGVVKLATDPQYFTYLSTAATRATVRVEIGDARLALAKTEDGSFDLIVLDAFSSDAIPTHLITKEAVQMYTRKLSTTGLLAFHVSNLYLDLAPVLGGIAGATGMQAARRFESEISEAELATRKGTSEWVVLARDWTAWDAIAANPNWQRLDAKPGAVWTDDYSNILAAFKSSWW